MVTGKKTMHLREPPAGQKIVQVLVFLFCAHFLEAKLFVFLSWYTIAQDTLAQCSILFCFAYTFCNHFPKSQAPPSYESTRTLCLGNGERNKHRFLLLFFIKITYLCQSLHCRYSVSVRRRLREATLNLTDLANPASAWSVSGESPGTTRGLNIR